MGSAAYHGEARFRRCGTAPSAMPRTTATGHIAPATRDAHHGDINAALTKASPNLLRDARRDRRARATIVFERCGAKVCSTDIQDGFDILTYARQGAVSSPAALRAPPRKLDGCW